MFLSNSVDMMKNLLTVGLIQNDFGGDKPYLPNIGGYHGPHVPKLFDGPDFKNTMI